VENAGVDETAIALVHGPGWPVAPPEAIGRLFDALLADPRAAAAVLLGPQTDTLKSIDARGLVTGTLDRSDYRAVLTPIAVRPGLLPAGARAPVVPGGALLDAAAVLRAVREASCAIVEVDV
jgi:2-C-methyl-D-erythritol 4-phosphate cytidylyltransferase